MEELPIPGYEGLYYVKGTQIISAERSVMTGGFPRRRKKRVLAQSVAAKGYLCVGLTLHGRRRTRSVHQLIAAAHLGPRPSGMFVCHNNGDRLDNRPCNLRYASPKENSSDMIAHGNSLRGDRCPSSKLTASEALRIFSAAHQGACQQWLADEFGVSRRTINGIANRRSWGSVTRPRHPQSRP